MFPSIIFAFFLSISSDSAPSASVIIMIRRFFSSNALNARKFLFVKEFKGEPTAANFELVKEDLPALKDGDILTSAEYLSVDPYMYV